MSDILDPQTTAEVAPQLAEAEQHQRVGQGGMRAEITACADPAIADHHRRHALRHLRGHRGRRDHDQIVMRMRVDEPGCERQTPPVDRARRRRRGGCRDPRDDPVAYLDVGAEGRAAAAVRRRQDAAADAAIGAGGARGAKRGIDDAWSTTIGTSRWLVAT